MTEADFSGKHLGVSGAMILAAFISGKYFQDNGALSSLTFSGAKSEYGRWVDGDPLTINISMTEADFSNKELGQLGGAQILAAFMGRKFFKDNGAMSILNVSNNNIGAEGAKALVPAM